MSICKKLIDELNEQYVRIDNVVDNLVSLDINKPLSAKQGVLLDSRIKLVESNIELLNEEMDSIESGAFDNIIDYIGDI